MQKHGITTFKICITINQKINQQGWTRKVKILKHWHGLRQQTWKIYFAKRSAERKPESTSSSINRDAKTRTIINYIFFSKACQLNYTTFGNELGSFSRACSRTDKRWEPKFRVDLESSYSITAGRHKRLERFLLFVILPETGFTKVYMSNLEL